MGTGWLREAWRQTQLCTHRRKPAQEEDSTADKTRAGGGPRGSSHHPLPLHTQGRGQRAAGCPGSNLRPAKTNVQEGPGRKRSPGPSCQTQRRGRSGSSPRRDFLGRAPFLGEPSNSDSSTGGSTFSPSLLHFRRPPGLRASCRVSRGLHG